MLPWDRRYAVAPANLFFHGEPYSHDFRRLLQNQIAEAAALGFRMNMGVEPELYVLRETDRRRGPVDRRGPGTTRRPAATTWRPRSWPTPFLEPMVGYMNELGWDVYSFDHEGGDGQYEFDFGYTDALQMADRMLIFRLMAKHVARTLGCFASFMPKPFQDLVRLRRASQRQPGRRSRPAVTCSTAGWPASRRHHGRRAARTRPTARSPTSSPPGCWPTPTP